MTLSAPCLTTRLNESKLYAEFLQSDGSSVFYRKISERQLYYHSSWNETCESQMTQFSLIFNTHCFQVLRSLVIFCPFKFLGLFKISNNQVKGAPNMLAHEHQILACIFEYLACWITCKISAAAETLKNFAKWNSRELW